MPYRLVVMGSCGVSKSVLTIRFLQNHFIAEYEPMTRDVYHGVAVGDGESYKLDILDILGGEDCIKLMEEGIHWGEGFLSVFAVDYIKTFEDVGIFWHQIHRVKGTNMVPVMLVANRINKAHCLVDLDLGKQASQSFRISCVEVSAKTRQGVEQTFCALIREIYQKRAEHELIVLTHREMWFFGSQN